MSDYEDRKAKIARSPGTVRDKIEALDRLRAEADEERRVAAFLSGATSMLACRLAEIVGATEDPFVKLCLAVLHRTPGADKDFLKCLEAMRAQQEAGGQTAKPTPTR